MFSNERVLSSVRSLVHPLLSDAHVLLFGSRANGSATEESDWDILIITQRKVDRALEKELQKRVFPLSVEIAAFIDLVIVQEQDWLTHPAYYSLRQSVAAGQLVS